MRRMPRRAGALVSLLGLLVVTAPFVAPAGAAECGGRIRTTRSGLFQWKSIDAPRFSTGGRDLTSYAVDPANPDHLYGTNGTVIAVSKDGGCKWKETYTGDGLVAGEIVRIVASAAGQAAAAAATATGPEVVITPDGGDTWEQGVGLPLQGNPDSFVFAESLPSNLFMGVDLGGGALDLLFASTDFGQTWVPRSDLSDVRANAGIDGLSVDELNPASVWAWGSGGLYHSINGGARFTPVDDFNGEKVTHVVARAGEAMAFLPEATPPQSSVTENNGRTWFRNDSPGTVTSADHGPQEDAIVISAHGEAYMFIANNFTWYDLDAPSPGFTDVRLHFGTGLGLFGRTPRTIERLLGFVLPSDHSTIIDTPRHISLKESAQAIREETSLGPDGRRVTLKQGESKTITYRLDLPRRPVPLDVYFLVDTSSSMTRTIDGMARSLEGIVNGLERENIDVEFGLAEFRSYPSANPPREEEPNYIYKQVVDIPASFDALSNAIADLSADAGGFYDAHLGALEQAATGRGEDVWPEGVDNDGDVPPGQQARFRAKTLDGLRVVIHASDEEFGSEKDRDNVTTDITKAPPPEIPSFEEVAAALNEKDIKHVGLSIGKAVYDDMARVSRATETFATGPVDCDGNGSIDVETGAPLVCMLRSNQSDKAFNLVPAVVGLLRAVQKQTEVRLEVDRGSAVVRDISPEQHEGVILQTENVLEFDVTYRCGAPQAGKRFPVRMHAESAIRLGAAVKAAVICEEEPAEQTPPVLPVLPLVGLVVPPLPPPPPAPVTQLNPATQTQAQAQAQAAAAHQEQEEAQLAFVTSFEEQQLQEETEFAMTSYRSRREAPAEALLGMGGVAVGMMCAAAVALRRRHQVHLAYQRRRP